MSGRAVLNATFPPGSALNYLKLARDQQVIGGGYAYPGILDASGYPISSPSSDIAQSVDLQRDISGYTGNWAAGWTGQLGQFRMSLAGAGLTVTTGASFISQSGFANDFSGNNGRVVFSFNGTDTSPVCYFRAGTYNGTLANLYLCRENEEALYLSGVHARPEYESILDYLDPLIIRSPPIAMNESNLTRWDYRHTPDAFCYVNNRWSPTAWAGTIGGTDTYTCNAATDTPGSWTDGEVIQGYVTNANTSTTPSLDCGARGAKTIVTEYNGVIGVGTIGANSLNTFVYDALLGKLLRKSGGIQSRTPIEIEVQIANSLNKPWWFLVPLMADDAYVLAMANYLFANMQQWFALELSNEIWNFFFRFSQTYITRDRGAALGFDPGNNRSIHGYYAKRFCEIVDIFKTVFGSDTRLRPTLGVQMHSSVSQYNTYRFQGTDLAAYGFNSAPNRPIDKASYVSPASYLSGAQVTNGDGNYNNVMTDALNAADDYASGNPAQMTAALLWLDGDLRAGTRNGSPGGQTVLNVATVVSGWNTVVAGHGKGLLEYEGGLEIIAPSTARLTVLGINTAYAAKFVTLIAAYKNSDYARQLVIDRFDGFMTNSSAVAPAWFDVIGNNQWALTTSMYATPFQTYEGFAEWSGDLDPPLALTPPTITGIATVGSVLTGVAGTYTNSPVLTHNWRRDGLNIGGQTGTTYTTQAADINHVIDWYELATNSDGTDDQDSNNITVVAAPVVVSGTGHLVSLIRASGNLGPSVRARGAHRTSARMAGSIRSGIHSQHTPAASSGAQGLDFSQASNSQYLPLLSGFL